RRKFAEIDFRINSRYSKTNMRQLLRSTWCKTTPASITAGVDCRRDCALMPRSVKVNSELPPANCYGTMNRDDNRVCGCVVSIVVIWGNRFLCLSSERTANHKDDDESQA